LMVPEGGPSASYVPSGGLRLSVQQVRPAGRPVPSRRSRPTAPRTSHEDSDRSEPAPRKLPAANPGGGQLSPTAHGGRPDEPARTSDSSKRPRLYFKSREFGYHFSVNGQGWRRHAKAQEKQFEATSSSSIGSWAPSSAWFCRPISMRIRSAISLSRSTRPRSGVPLRQPRRDFHRRSARVLPRVRGHSQRLHGTSHFLNHVFIAPGTSTRSWPSRRRRALPNR